MASVKYIPVSHFPLLISACYYRHIFFVLFFFSVTSFAPVFRANKERREEKSKTGKREEDLLFLFVSEDVIC